MRDAIEVMQAELDTTIDPRTWRSTQFEFDEARALLNLVGVADDPYQADVVLDLRRSPRLILRVLEGEYDSEVRCLRDAQEEGHPLSQSILALERLVIEVRVRTGGRKRRSNHSFLEAKVEERRIRGRRDNAE